MVSRGFGARRPRFGLLSGSERAGLGGIALPGCHPTGGPCRLAQAGCPRSGPPAADDGQQRNRRPRNKSVDFRRRESVNGEELARGLGSGDGAGGPRSSNATRPESSVGNASTNWLKTKSTIPAPLHWPTFTLSRRCPPRSSRSQTLRTKGGVTQSSLRRARPPGSGKCLAVSSEISTPRNGYGQSVVRPRPPPGHWPKA